MWFKNGLKAQKLLAQGIALGIMAANKAPCKGKSLINCLRLESFCPYRATGLCPLIPRVLPWAKSFCPFRAYGAILAKSRHIIKWHIIKPVYNKVYAWHTIIYKKQIYIYI